MRYDWSLKIRASAGQFHASTYQTTALGLPRREASGRYRAIHTSEVGKTNSEQRIGPRDGLHTNSSTPARSAFSALNCELKTDKKNPTAQLKQQREGRRMVLTRCDFCPVRRLDGVVVRASALQYADLGRDVERTVRARYQHLFRALFNKDLVNWSCRVLSNYKWMNVCHICFFLAPL